MNDISQDNRLARFICEKSNGELQLHRLTAADKVGQLYHYELDLVSTSANVPLKDLLGQPAAVEFDLKGDETRYFNGYITKITYTGTQRIASGDEISTYRATISPWLWFLTRTSDCRIYQNKSIPKIVEEACTNIDVEGNKKNTFVNIDASFLDQAKYKDKEYVVQYRESTFNFVSRLLEQEGIYYYFKHEKNSHIMVLCDAVNAHAAAPGYEHAPFMIENRELNETDHVTSWSVSQGVQPGVFVLKDYNFTNSGDPLKTTCVMPGAYDHSEGEVFDYPGEFNVGDDGDVYTQARAEEAASKIESYRAGGTSTNLLVGNLFSLTNHPRQNQNKEYLVLETNYYIENNGYFTGSESSEGTNCECNLTCIDKKVTYRPQRITPKPMIQGPQTATVVGGGEIDTNEYGQVKVKFHWDRNPADTETSKWIRVSQVWAGKDWGTQHIPHVGHEVIVEHLEGDPDCPIITGRVYNNSNMPSEPLDANKTRSVWRDHSANELIMEGKSGSEDFIINAEKDKNVTTKNNNTESVGGDETLTVSKNRKRTVEKSETVTVQRNRNHLVWINEMIGIGAAQEVNIGGFQAIDVVGYQMVNIGGYQNNNIVGWQSVEVGQKQTTTYQKDHEMTVGLNRTTTITETETLGVKNRQVEVEENDDLLVNGEKISRIMADFTIECGNNMRILATEEIEFVVGDSSLSMKKDGKIVLKGKDVEITNGKGKVHIEDATGHVVVNGPMVRINT